MTESAYTRLLLGPQRPEINLAEAMGAAGLASGSIATISAGWQEGEDDIDDLRAVVGQPLLDLRLYYRAEEVFGADPNLAAAYRARQDQLKKQQRLYRRRLKQLAIAARDTINADGEAEMIAAEQRHAVAQLRALDRHQLQRTEILHQPFNAAYNAETHSLLARHVGEIGEIISACSAVLITGGNVVVLLNRMRLFGVDQMLENKHIIAWSAGAMALTKRIVLFHDRAPHGWRDPEVLGSGCGLISDRVFFPNAAYRLRENKRERIELLCRRFAPDTCITLDNGSELQLSGTETVSAVEVRRLRRNGSIAKLRAA